MLSYNLHAHSYIPYHYYMHHTCYSCAYVRVYIIELIQFQLYYVEYMQINIQMKWLTLYICWFSAQFLFFSHMAIAVAVIDWRIFIIAAFWHIANNTFICDIERKKKNRQNKVNKQTNFSIILTILLQNCNNNKFAFALKLNIEIWNIKCVLTAYCLVKLMIAMNNIERYIL